MLDASADRILARLCPRGDEEPEFLEGDEAGAPEADALSLVHKHACSAIDACSAIAQQLHQLRSEFDLKRAEAETLREQILLFGSKQHLEGLADEQLQHLVKESQVGILQITRRRDGSRAKQTANTSRACCVNGTYRGRLRGAALWPTRRTRRPRSARSVCNR